MCVSTRSLTQPFLPTDDLSKAIFPEASIEFFARGEQAFHGPSSGGFYQKTLFTLRERGKPPPPRIVGVHLALLPVPYQRRYRS